MKGQIRLRRASDPPGPGDGFRVLVDRDWPCCLNPEALNFDQWLRDIAPGPEFCTWYSLRAERWSEFRRRYIAELVHGGFRPALDSLVGIGRQHEVISLVVGEQDPERSHAAVVREVLRAALFLPLPPGHHSLSRALEDLSPAERLGLERLVRERLDAHSGASLAADVMVVAFGAFYIDGRTAGLCHDGALELFGEAVREHVSSQSVEQPTDRRPRSAAATAGPD